MTSSSLNPPNIQDLSDTVIGSVRQHAKRDSKVFSVQEIRGQTLNATATIAIMAINGQELQKTETSVDQDQQYTDPVGYRRLLRRRQSRRDIQHRYRAKVHARSVALENSVERLKDEVRRLVQQCRHLSTDPLSTTTPWNIVAEYFALFRHGFNSSSTASVVSEPSPSSKKLMFLLGTMASSVMVKSGSGITAMLGIWRSISRRYDGLDVRLVRRVFHRYDQVLFHHHQSMLLQEFPHLVTEEGKLPPLAEKLLGQQIVLPSGARFDWDESTARMAAVTGRNFKAEMLTPLLKILGNLEDVAFVLG
ncbi:hypothetical protein GQ600_15703 [Phytophthora cactorum]|nr:hypothetical protein GQ600_15703 [Phytophthora cactorum]